VSAAAHIIQLCVSVYSIEYEWGWTLQESDLPLKESSYGTEAFQKPLLDPQMGGQKPSLDKWRIIDYDYLYTVLHSRKALRKAHSKVRTSRISKAVCMNYPVYFT
jgi:hypothetical protein